jgi:hypothetical protein
MSDITLHRDELQILINLLSEIRVSFPLYDGDLLVARPSGGGFLLDLPSGREDFQAWLSRYEPIAEELPSYSDLLECMLSCGIIRYENQAAFDEMLTSYRILKKDVLFGLDTNLFYQCFAANTPAINPSSYLIVDTVRDEITYAINHKYPARKIGEMAACAPKHKHLIEELENKRTKRSRKAAYLALREYRSIRDRATEVASPGVHTHLKEENDRTIVRALRRFEDERYALPVLLTADIYMADLCEAEGLEYFYFQRPHIIGATSCTASALRQLLFTLAAVFGFVSCNGHIVFGEYGGKGNDLDELKVRMEDGEGFLELRREVTICRQLRALEIPG